MPWRLFRHAVNVAVLFSALVVAPLMFAAHFSASLAGFFGDFADRYLPQSTLLATEKKAHRRALARERQRSVDAAREKARTRAAAKARRGAALGKGRRILVRGSAAMAVGLVPVVGLSADVYSLAEDYVDVCDLLRIIDDMSAALGLEVVEADVEGDPAGPGALQVQSLYRQNYCHKPEEGLELIRQQADQFDWP